MGDISTSERFFRTLGDCQQMFKDREDELLADVLFRDRVIERKKEKIRELEEELESTSREVERLKKFVDSNRPPSVDEYVKEQKVLADTRAFELKVKEEEIKELNKTIRELRGSFRPASVYDFVREQKELADARAVELITKDEEIDKLKQTLDQMKTVEDEQDVELEQLKREVKNLKRILQDQQLELCAQEYIVDEFKEQVQEKDLLIDSKDGDVERESKKVAELESQLKSKEGELVNEKRVKESMRRDMEAKEKELDAWKKMVEEVCPERVPWEKIPPILHSQFMVSSLSVQSFREIVINFKLYTFFSVFFSGDAGNSGFWTAQLRRPQLRTIRGQRSWHDGSEDFHADADAPGGRRTRYRGPDGVPTLRAASRAGHLPEEGILS
jgi:hypothetical protein